MDFTVLGSIAGLMGVIVGVTQVLKPLIPSKLTPVLATVVGVAVGVGLSLFEAAGLDLQTGIITGLLLGLSASGAYDYKILFK